jgi:hypothetical protein
VLEAVEDKISDSQEIKETSDVIVVSDDEEGLDEMSHKIPKAYSEAVEENKSFESTIENEIMILNYRLKKKLPVTKPILW